MHRDPIHPIKVTIVDHAREFSLSKLARVDKILRRGVLIFKLKPMMRYNTATPKRYLSSNYSRVH